MNFSNGSIRREINIKEAVSWGPRYWIFLLYGQFGVNGKVRKIRPNECHNQETFEWLERKIRPKEEHDK